MKLYIKMRFILCTKSKCITCENLNLRLWGPYASCQRAQNLSLRMGGSHIELECCLWNMFGLECDSNFLKILNTMNHIHMQ